MDHIIACDCGGTKCAFLLCALDGTVRASVTGGTGNSSFESSADIAAKIRALLLQLREESNVDPATVVAWGGVLMLDYKLVEPTVHELFPACRTFQSYGEFSVNLLASAGVEEGFVAHSGTGSFAVALQGGKTFHYGGLGSYLGDEGSGYNVGLNTFHAVKHHLVGLGPATVMTEMLMDEWEITREEGIQKTLWAIAGKCISLSSESRLRISRLTRIAARAAKAGDEVAKEVLRRAARDLRDQVRVVVETEGADPHGILTVSGGTWHCGPDMLDTFAHETCALYPGLRFVRPRLEPIAGVAASLLRDSFGITPCEEIFAKLPAWEK